MNYFQIFTIFSAFYSILPIIITIKMTVFYIKNRSSLTPNTLHPVLYLQFLIMQFLNFLHVISTFLVSRIPDGGWFMEEMCQRESYLRFLIFLSYGAVYAKNFSTISFCLTRVFILFMDDGKEACQFIYLTLFLIPVAFLLALPRNIVEAKCVLMEPPFPSGAVMIVSDLGSENKMSDSQIIEAVFYPSVIIVILSLTFLMFWKLLQSRKLSTLVGRKFDRNAERSLTITMILILLPVIVNSSIAILGIFNYSSFILYVLRPWMIDARCHIIVCYFYFTHPIFKRKRVSQKILKSKDTK
ncbi:hypothetical protein CAEBREN_19101 [Caenorhabditis brenneri]|uniref:Uncharacterized protein n=1 Tax=Caenorhabditis brenneri TaxID=135651 RepID=G0NFM2_CAEBE|nr:hypothetical protein CAEBREN_19101 [Caenorhabditis brenneri]